MQFILILHSLSAISLCPLFNPLIGWTSLFPTSRPQLRSFASIDPSLWNRLPLRSAPPSSLVVYLSLTSEPVLSFGVKLF